MAAQKTIFDKWAKEREITTEEMKNIILERIKKGLNDPDPEKRVQWEKIPHAGKIPTPEEWISYVVEKLKENGREDLLQWPLDR